MNGDETIGALAERHRAQAEAVDEAENGDVGADADRERKERRDHESWSLFEPAPRVKQVTKESAHGGDHIKPGATKPQDSGRIRRSPGRWRSCPNQRVRSRAPQAPQAP